MNEKRYHSRALALPPLLSSNRLLLAASRRLCGHDEEEVAELGLFAELVTKLFRGSLGAILLYPEEQAQLGAHLMRRSGAQTEGGSELEHVYGSDHLLRLLGNPHAPCCPKCAPASTTPSSPVSSGAAGPHGALSTFVGRNRRKAAEAARGAAQAFYLSSRRTPRVSRRPRPFLSSHGFRFCSSEAVPRRQGHGESLIAAFRYLNEEATFAELLGSKP